MPDYTGPERRQLPASCQTGVLEMLLEMKAQQQANAAMLKHALTFITGNGTPEKGAVVRLDRLEQAEGIRAKHANYVWASIITLGIKAVWDTLVLKR